MNHWLWQRDRYRDAVRTAAELQGRDWGSALRTDDDFVVYVADLEGGDGDKDVRRDAPVAVRARLARRGLL